MKLTMFCLGGLLFLFAVIWLASCGSTPVAEKEYNGSNYVGKEACQTCHPEEYELFMKSGHAWKLNKVIDGNAPVFPFTEMPELPKDTTWNDVLYVIGGYNWKARFIGKDGYIITGPEGNSDYLNQWNFANPVVGKEAGWVKFHSGEKVPYDCGACHTTGYSPQDHQDDLEGLVGTWAEEGITCEECHGPGSTHVADPYGAVPVINRDAELCGECHIRGSIENVNAENGFIRHHEQYEELYQSKHITIDCNICHNPHAGVVQLRKAEVQTTRIQCENCHFQEAKFQDSQVDMATQVNCIDCHMPRITKSAVGDAEKFTGDIRTHIMAIDFDQIGQFSEDGKTVYSQIGLNFACRNCHVEGGKASPKTDDELRQKAFDYHARRAP